MTADRIRQIIPADGWRTVTAFLGAEGDLAQLPNSELFAVEPIACFALFDEFETGNRHVKPIVPQDWPAYLYEADDDTVLDLLGPGEEVEADHRLLAIELITERRERRAREREAASPTQGEERSSGA